MFFLQKEKKKDPKVVELESQQETQDKKLCRLKEEFEKKRRELLTITLERTVQ